MFTLFLVTDVLLNHAYTAHYHPELGFQEPIKCYLAFPFLLTLWVRTVSGHCEWALWVGTVSGHCECALWVRTVSAHCECALWVRTVSAHCAALCRITLSPVQNIPVNSYVCVCTHTILSKRTHRTGRIIRFIASQISTCPLVLHSNFYPTKAYFSHQNDKWVGL